MSEMIQGNSRAQSRKVSISYIVGFILSLALAAVAFALVQYHMLPQMSLYVVLSVLLLMTIIGQIVFFFRFSARTETGKWNIVSLFFTLIIVVVVVGGSLWIMYNLNYYMVH